MTQVATIDWLSPSEAETAAVAQDALKAARYAVAPMAVSNVDEQFIKKCILAAFIGCAAVVRSASAAFAARHVDSKCHEFFIDSHHVVASALAGTLWTECDVQPYSHLGTYFVSFASVTKAMDAYSSAMAALEEPDGALYGSYYASNLLLAAEVAG